MMNKPIDEMLVVCRSKSGREYLRAPANNSFQKDLYDLIHHGAS
jgi:hypothetical protein